MESFLKVVSEQTKQNKDQHIDTENRLVVTRGERGWGRAKWVKGVNSMVTDGNYTFGGEHTVVYTEVKLECYTHETYMIL